MIREVDGEGIIRQLGVQQVGTSSMNRDDGCRVMQGKATVEFDVSEELTYRSHPVSSEVTQRADPSLDNLWVERNW